MGCSLEAADSPEEVVDLDRDREACMHILLAHLSTSAHKIVGCRYIPAYTCLRGSK